MKYFVLVFVVLISNVTMALEEHILECTPEENEKGFKASIKLKQLNTTWTGKINGFEIYGKWDMPKGCSLPEVAELDLGGHLDQKFYYHENEYEKGCIFRVVFLSTVGVSAWVYLKDDYYNQSNKLHAKCSNI